MVEVFVCGFGWGVYWLYFFFFFAIAEDRCFLLSGSFAVCRLRCRFSQ